MARSQTTAKKGRASTSKDRRKEPTPRPVRRRQDLGQRQPVPQHQREASAADPEAEEARRRATAPTFEPDARSRRAGLGFRDDDAP